MWELSGAFGESHQAERAREGSDNYKHAKHDRHKHKVCSIQPKATICWFLPLWRVICKQITCRHPSRCQSRAVNKSSPYLPHPSLSLKPLLCQLLVKGVNVVDGLKYALDSFVHQFDPFVRTYLPTCQSQQCAEVSRISLVNFCVSFTTSIWTNMKCIVQPASVTIIRSCGGEVARQ